LSEAQRRLVAAFFDGVPELDVLRGNPLHRLCRVAAEANGSLDALCTIASDVREGGKWLDRVRRLEEALVAEPAERPWPRARSVAEIMAELDGPVTADVGRQALEELKSQVRATRASNPAVE